MLIRWSNLFETGVPEIDNQHRKLIDIMNELYIIYCDKKNVDIKLIIYKLIDYSNYHFDTEEKYFAEQNFSHAQKHIKEHLFFREKIKTFLLYDTCNDKAFNEIMTFMKDWFINHILTSDRRDIGILKNMP